MEDEENKMEQLRKLEKNATKSAMVSSIVIGTISTLIFGTGMSLAMEWKEFFILGIIVGVIGIVGITLAYPVYSRMIKKRREKIASEIKRLSDELLI